MAMDEAVQRIANKMRAERPTIKKYCHMRGKGEGAAGHEWGTTTNGNLNAAYRAGSANAYFDVERMIDKGLFADVGQHDGAQKFVEIVKASWRLFAGSYRDWAVSGGVNECAHGIAEGFACQRCDELLLRKTYDQLSAKPAKDPEQDKTEAAPPVPDVRMTEQEKEAMAHLVKFWNAWLALPVEDDSSSSRVCESIHTIQGLMAIRVARRVNPDIWR